MNNFPFGSEQVSNIDIVKSRTANINDTFKAIDEAKSVLKALEELAVLRAEGQLIDIPTVSHNTHNLRDCVNRILVGLIESQTLPPRV